MINVYCRDFGWLFEDLKRDIAAVADDVVASDNPLPDADAWICIRTNEARTPVAGWFPEQWAPRTVVQVHDFYTRSPLIRYGAVSLVHPDQRKTCPTADKVHVQPIGARRLFTLRYSMPERFTVGWVGRDVTHEGRHIKRPQLFVDAVLEARRQGCEVFAKMHGPDLYGFAKQIAAARSPIKEGFIKAAYGAAGCSWVGDLGRAESLRDFYHSIDALVVTCEPEPGPLSVYEALACGVPVIVAAEDELSFPACTERGISPVHPEAIHAAIETVADLRGEWFEHRAEIRASVTRWQDDWCGAQVELARGLC